MAIDYPLRFAPIFRRYLWGGRRLGTSLRKPIGPEPDYAESWEVVDHGADQSRVTHGSLTGRTLHELMERDTRSLLGPDHPHDSFPLLFKFLDCHRKLSVQVHPNDEQAGRLVPPDRGKTEAWIILDAAPGSIVHAGLKRGFDRAALTREVARGTTELCLHAIEVRPGDCIFIPAGTVHALGDGLLVAEIQQASDTTFRLYDWNRVDASGQSRPLHIEASLDTIDYALGPISVQTPQATSNSFAERLVACDKFIVDRWNLERSQKVDIETRGSCHMVAVLSGSVALGGDPSGAALAAGQVALIPAAMDRCEVGAHQSSQLLDISLPMQQRQH